MTQLPYTLIIRKTMNDEIKNYLAEDMGERDVTTDAIVPEDHVSAARILAKENGVIAGHSYASAVFHHLDGNLVYEDLKKDGEA